MYSAKINRVRVKKQHNRESSR